MPLDRRRLLGSAGMIGLGMVGLTGCAGALDDRSEIAPDTGVDGGPVRASTRCVPRSALTRRTTMGGRALVYEVSGRRSAFWFDPGFHDQLDAWWERFTTGSRIAAPDQVWTYGSWTDGGDACDSWHHSGRAFDLARLRRSGRTLVSCRYDQWRDGADADLQRRRYWALAASLHHDFADVLTYLYNAQHHNHIHVDNGRSGAGPSRLRTRSDTQVQSVQAMLTYLWDQPVDLTGRWDAATRRAQRRVLDRIEIGDDLDGSDEAWRGFLRASTARFPSD